MAAIRPIRPDDVIVCGRIAFDAHQKVAALHGFPLEQPSVEAATSLLLNKMNQRGVAGFVAESDGEIVGSIFLNTFCPSPVAAIGPLTVDPARSAPGAGAALMGAALDEAAGRGYNSIRLVQSPAHFRSLGLYTKMGFTVREPLALISGEPPRGFQPGSAQVRPLTFNDMDACNAICTHIHGFTRQMEVRLAIENKTALGVERAGRFTGYAAGVGFRSHAVAESATDLMALICATPTFQGPGFFAPIRNHKLLSLLFKAGLRSAWPANLMTRGSYIEPCGAFLPSIAY